MPNDQNYDLAEQQRRVKYENHSAFLISVLDRSPRALSTEKLTPEGRGWWPLPQRKLEPTVPCPPYMRKPREK